MTDETQTFSTVHHSPTTPSSLSDPMNALFPYGIPPTSTIPSDVNQGNFIIPKIKSPLWSPTMPTVMPLISSATSTTTYVATSPFANNANDYARSNENHSMMYENFTGNPDIIIKQEQQTIRNERMNDNSMEFVRPYEYNSEIYPSLSSSRNATIINHGIHINPSVLLSEHRANYHGPGTPMPNLSHDYYHSYQSSNWSGSMTITDIVSSRKRRPRRRKNNACNDNERKQTEFNEYFDTVEPADIANVILQTKVKNNKKCKRRKKLMAEKKNEIAVIDVCKRKKLDARLWLNAKAKLMREVQSDVAPSYVTTEFQDSASELNCHRFVDRATSPINFTDNKQIIKCETKDVALSPIRLIEPQLKRQRFH